MSNRLLRVNELLQREISAFLHQKYSGETVALTITGVETTGDLRESRIFYSVLGEGADGAKAGKWLAVHRDEIRAHIAKHVVLRHVPLLAFVYDNHQPRTLRIESILSEIDRKEGKA